MQKIVRTLSVLALTVAAGACTKPDCIPPVIKKIQLYSNTGTLTSINDTSATIDKYNPGKDFSQRAETYPNVEINKDKLIEFPEKGTITYDYDWIITLHPSNKEYRISKIKHDDKNTAGNNCTSTVTYTINDSSYKVPGNPYSTTPYYTSDIKIRWDE